jgi:peptidoglycan/LPS O-acetylase OafA/YrhL
MSLILNEKYVGVNNSYRLFITNRFFRLFPIYWTVLIGTIITCIGVAFFSKGHIIPKFDSYLSVKANIFSFGYLILTNLIIFGQDIVMFLGIIPANGHLFFTSNFLSSNPQLNSFLFIPQAWTLGLELTFYLIAPFILKRGYKIIVAIIISSFLLRLYLYNYLGFQNDPWTYRFFPNEIMFFLLGYLSYRIYLKLKLKLIPKRYNLFILLFILLFTLTYPEIPSIKVNYLPFSIKEMIYFTSILISIPFLFNFFKKNKLDNQLGELSYPVYISHMLVVTSFFGLPFMILKTGWIISIVTIILAYLLNKIVASPVEKYRQSRLKK